MPSQSYQLAYGEPNRRVIMSLIPQHGAQIFCHRSSHLPRRSIRGWLITEGNALEVTTLLRALFLLLAFPLAAFLTKASPQVSIQRHRNPLLLAASSASSYAVTATAPAALSHRHPSFSSLKFP